MEGSEQLRLLLGEPLVVSVYRLVKTELDFAAIAACGITPEGGGARLPHGADALWGARRRAAPPAAAAAGVGGRCNVTHHARVGFILLTNLDSLFTSYLPSESGSVHKNTYQFVISRR